jgi:hypothetical protein
MILKIINILQVLHFLWSHNKPYPSLEDSVDLLKDLFACFGASQDQKGELITRFLFPPCPEGEIVII